MMTIVRPPEAPPTGARGRESRHAIARPAAGEEDTRLTRCVRPIHLHTIGRDTP
jgi:hypothetical protein